MDSVPPLLLLLLFGLSIFQILADCKFDQNATYEPEPAGSGAMNYTGIVRCKPGYNSPTHNQSVKCVNGYWKEETKNCLVCDENHYGENCSNVVGYCSYACMYDAVEGCKVNLSRESEKPNGSACDLQNAIITLPAKASATALIHDFLTITATVTVVQKDIVDYSVTKEDGSSVIPEPTLMHFPEAGVNITFTVDSTDTSNSGIYIVTVITKFSELAANTSVTVYVPVEVKIYEMNSNDEVIEASKVNIGSKASWTCKGTGHTMPSVDWTFQGITVNNVEIKDKIYQTKEIKNGVSMSTLYVRPSKGFSKKESGVYACHGVNDGDAESYCDVASFTLTVSDGTEPVYTERKNFVIACAVLGSLTIVVFICLAIACICSRPRGKKQDHHDSGNATLSGSSIRHVSYVNAVEEPTLLVHEPRSPPEKSSGRLPSNKPHRRRKTYQDTIPEKASIKSDQSGYDGVIPTSDRNYEAPNTSGRISEPHIYEQTIAASN